MYMYIKVHFNSNATIYKYSEIGLSQKRSMHLQSKGERVKLTSDYCRICPKKWEDPL